MKVLSRSIAAGLFSAVSAVVFSAKLSAQVYPLNPSANSSAPQIDIDGVAKRALKAFDTPGMAIGIVHKGQVKFAGGFGQSDLGGAVAVNENTLFRVASTTKAFTSAALAVLVDDGVIGWDDKVIDYLSDFRMYDPWVTREFTIRDLLTHRSGLGLGAGDLMLWPEPSGFSRQELVHNLRYLKPVTSFRGEYAYDNLLYIVAGEVVAAAAGMSWENFVQSRILNPLEMQCYSGDVPTSKRRQTAVPYGLIGEKMMEISRNRIENASNVSAAAGGLVCSAAGMNTWMMTLLSGGVGPNGVRVFNEKRRSEMWTSQTVLRVSKSERELDGTHSKTYALGWRKEDMHGYEVISHTGTLSGFQAYVGLVPEMDLGVVVLNNGSNSGARSSVMQSVLKAYMGQTQTDWVQYYADAQAKWRLEKANTPKASNDNNRGSGSVALPISAYAGVYKDPWFGKVDIVQEGDKLRFQSRKMIKMVGTLTPFDMNTFIVTWDDREFRADAYMRFDTTFQGSISGASMQHVAEDGDWSFDFQDLAFTRVDN